MTWGNFHGSLITEEGKDTRQKSVTAIKVKYGLRAESQITVCQDNSTADRC